MADKTKITTFKPFNPKIYAYTTPGYTPNDGWTKIGYTEQEVDVRIRQQTRTAHVKAQKEWEESAIYRTPEVEPFKDHDFHRFLQKIGIERMKGENGARPPEFFRISPEDALNYLYEFKSHHGYPDGKNHEAIPYNLRDEQDEAISQTVSYFLEHEKGEFLWNAKPRFGKTLSVYDFMKRIDAKNVLIVTNYPTIGNSWFKDYKTFIGPKDHYRFVTKADLKSDELLLDEKGYKHYKRDDPEMHTIWFTSLQDLKTAKPFGGEYDKLWELAEIDWDLLVIDEAHMAIDTAKTDVAFDRIKRAFTLHLSGTPFKALANDKFQADAIYNWTYADEQAKKQRLIEAGIENSPYRDLPTMNLFTYQMGDIVADQIEKKIKIGDNTVEFAFDLNEFFKTKNGNFIYETAVDQWLNALSTHEKFPFSTLELRDKLKHTFWILNSVDSVNALEKKLKNHPVFKDYKIVNVAGSMKTDDEAKESQEALTRVQEAIHNSDKTITLSAGRLTTGITIPEWSAVMMLSNMKSPALYMQTAFRAQNPYRYQNENGEWIRKENAYVFDFDPARTLNLFEKFALDLDTRTSDGRASRESRETKIKELLNFFPVIGEDSQGKMIELDALRVLSIPRKIRSQEVIKRGFMSNFLFQNVAQVFNAPQEIIQLVLQFEPVEEPKGITVIEEGDGERLNIDSEGHINLSEEKVIGLHKEIFGDKVYGLKNDEERKRKSDELRKELERKKASRQAKRQEVDAIKKALQSNLDEIKKDVKEKYKDNFQVKDQKHWDRMVDVKAERVANRLYQNKKIEEDILNKEKEQALKQASTQQEFQHIKNEFEQKTAQLEANYIEGILEQQNLFTDQAMNDILKAAEISSSELEVKQKTDTLKDHLRGFSRTIPSFLMAYGDENLRLDNLEEYINEDVFKEVTSITLDEFKILRDGIRKDGKEIFRGQLFDETVFNDSVQEFLKKKKELENYFNPNQKDDIFNYIPPQKTNQIFTPKRVVKEMVDALEIENPGIFDDPTKTFADLYMKSGLYIAEIVRRLFNSDGLKIAFPDDKERLHHIFSKQVYGLAPTQIIYLIARNYILGFADNPEEYEHNLVMADASKAAQEGKLQELVDKYFN